MYRFLWKKPPVWVVDKSNYNTKTILNKRGLWRWIWFPERAVGIADRHNFEDNYNHKEIMGHYRPGIMIMMYVIMIYAPRNMKTKTT